MMYIDAEFVGFEEKEFSIKGKNVISRQLTVRIGETVKTFKSANVSKELDTKKIYQFKMGDKVELRAEPKTIKAKTIPFNEGDTSREIEIESYVVADVDLK